MLPRGFKLCTAEAAIKAPGRADILLVSSDTDAVVAGTFTKNSVRSATVRLTMPRIRAGKGRAVIMSSGNANACTGPQGMKDAQEITASVAGHLGVKERLVSLCTTGVIGVPLPMARIRPVLRTLVQGLGTASLKQAAGAIMTTDTVPKYLVKKVKVGGRQGVIAGICKGAGMIEPNMATMLSVIMTDIAIDKAALSSALKHAVDASFNRITVDGTGSTNDSVIVMANGWTGNRPLTARSPGFKVFRDALAALCYELAYKIVADGEGATKVIAVILKGAKSDAEALRGARAVANSMLVKTALYGNDPNWGRIMADLGSSGIAMKEDRIDISIGRIKLLAKGSPTGREKLAEKEIRKKLVTITADLRMGKGAARMLTCDLSEEYVRINAEYTT